MSVKLRLWCVAVLFALPSTAYTASCMKPPASTEVVGHFRSNPLSLIEPNTDTRTIEAKVRELAGTDAMLASDIVAVARGATPRFQAAIAAGLAQAAIACSTSDQVAAQLIQRAVASFDNGPFQSVFAAVAGDLSTAAVGAAAAEAGAGAGSVVTINSNQKATSTTRIGGGAISSLVLTSPGQTSLVIRATPSTTAASSVSPTR